MSMSAEGQFQQAFNDGVQYAAQNLMDRLVSDAGIRDDGWNGGNVVAVVDRWLQEHGIDTSVPDDDDEEPEDDAKHGIDDRFVKSITGIPQYGEGDPKSDPCAWCGDTPTEGTSAAGERLCADDAAADDADNGVVWDEDAPQSIQARYRYPYACTCGERFAEIWQREDHWNTSRGDHGQPIGSE